MRRLEQPTPSVSFDEQATTYEARAGIPLDIGRAVAAHLTEGLPPFAAVIDVGAGTGTIGRHLVSADLRYFGLDVSRPMLAEFSRNLPILLADAAAPVLLPADADLPWPLPDHFANLILFSRSLHLLKSERIFDEVLRIAAPGCRVLVGKVRRAQGCPREQLKRRMQELLRNRNLPGKSGEGAKRVFLEALAHRGARPVSAWASVTWSTNEAPNDALRSWRGKSGLGGRVIADEIKHKLLDELEGWAQARFGDLTTQQQVLQHYEIEGVQLAH